MNTWLRGKHDRTVHVLNGCPHAGGARPWTMVDGWDDRAVMAQIAQVPWLRLCRDCAGALARADEQNSGKPVRLSVVQ